MATIGTTETDFALYVNQTSDTINASLETLFLSKHVKVLSWDDFWKKKSFLSHAVLQEWYKITIGFLCIVMREWTLLMCYMK